MNARNEPGGRGERGPRVEGKFLEVEGRRFLVKGVTYGTFAPDASGAHFPSAERVEQDFAGMAAVGFNTVRTYTPPPPAVLDAALRHDLRLMVGLAWPQHIPFLDDRALTRRIRRDAVETVCRIATHPAALLFVLGNEIPAGIVRWHGHKRIDRFLADLYHEVKSSATHSLLTYANFPPTEHLDLDVFDVFAYNVYLHEERDLRGYLARLQHLAGPRPLLLAEAGADSIREGPEDQALITATHVRAAFDEGACGAVVFSWTDEWWRGGTAVDDWAFGLVDSNRQPKPALAAVERVLRDAPFPASEAARWPRVSVVVCAYDAADTIADCLTSLERLRYPDVEVIVVNDGSRDGTGDIASRYPGVRVINVENGGLSAARNTGLAAATGEIVAYTDADVRVDPDWLTYLVQPLLTSDVVGVGGPNVVPNDDPWVAQCVARAPGAPTHVMLDDRIAEHVPGCNMAFRKDALIEIDGFNPVYTRAGDDVDICWRLHARKLKIGFAPAGLVWHHHRSSVRAYWRQQVGYGEGEAWLDAHHPEKFLGGRLSWRGSVYSPLPFLRSSAERRVNTGVWGTAAFPSIYSAIGHGWRYLPHSPAWMALSFVLFNIGFWGPLAGMDAAWLPLIAGSLGGAATLARCLQCAWRSNLDGLPRIGSLSVRRSRFRYRMLIAWLHLLQPLARLRGWLRGQSARHAVAARHMTGHPWKPPRPTLRDFVASARLVTLKGMERSFWSERWVSPASLLTELVGSLRAARPAQVVEVDEGWHPDRDLSVAVGKWGWLHLRSVVEEHENGACLLRTRTRLRPSFMGTLRGATLAVVVAGGASASVFIYDLSVTLFVSTLAIVGIGARAAWQAIRSATILDRALARVTASSGMFTLPVASKAGSTEPRPVPSLEHVEARR
ncbi:MAG: glycosyltransferase [Gemmatimonadetes bacterium]|nr:glycosyltransferase [Gemmatimonadota bacterium]MDA1103979.1 glycosyltransferase [Gemmatimonadota bacterium]